MSYYAEISRNNVVWPVTIFKVRDSLGWRFSPLSGRIRVYHYGEKIGSMPAQARAPFISMLINKFTNSSSGQGHNQKP